MTLQMQLYSVQVATTIGVVVSIWLVMDAWRDRRVRDFVGSRLADILTLDRLVSEIVRLVMQLMFLFVAVIYSNESFVTFERHALWVLILAPILLAGWSIWSWLYRRRVLREEEEDDE